MSNRRIGKGSAATSTGTSYVPCTWIIHGKCIDKVLSVDVKDMILSV